MNSSSPKRKAEEAAASPPPAKKRVKAPPATQVYNTFTQHQVKKIAKSLIKHGYAVVMPVGDSIIDRAATRSSIDKEISEFREFSSEASDRTPLGGFAAYGNPSSFHNPTVRKLRLDAYNIISPALDRLAQKTGEGYNKEALIDRLLVRPPKRSPSAESWHRDESPAAADDDVVLGGWWNLDDKASQFSCIPRTHKAVSGHSGFATIKDKAQIQQFNSSKYCINIPPGAILLFNEQLIHEVVATKRAYTSYRLFLGWRITRASTPLFGDSLATQLEEQAPITIKSGQEPPMWAKLHWTNWVDKLVAFSANFNDACREPLTIKSGKRAGEQFSIVHRSMKSLKQYGFPLYAPYTEAETAILKPH